LRGNQQLRQSDVAGDGIADTECGGRCKPAVGGKVEKDERSLGHPPRHDSQTFIRHTADLRGEIVRKAPFRDLTHRIPPKL